MDRTLKQKQNEMVAELNKLIAELDLIAQGVRSDFRHIGNDRCADAITKVRNQYIKARNELRKL